MDPKLTTLAELIAKRHEIELEIARLVGRPGSMNNVGEFVAAQVFDLHLDPTAAPKGYDGQFRSGPLAGQKVNIQWYGKLDWNMDVDPKAVPDLYLVMTGPLPDGAGGSGGKEKARPWSIEHVFLFDAREVVRQLGVRQVKMGSATSIPKKWWETAEVYPSGSCRLLRLSQAQTEMLGLFGGKGYGKK